MIEDDGMGIRAEDQSRAADLWNGRHAERIGNLGGKMKVISREGREHASK